MARTFLGIVASPRNLGNSELFIKEVYRRLSGEWELKLLRLPELDIRPCRACYACLFGEMRCTQKDDFPMALEALAGADAFAVAAPTYFLGANASLKRFLDRGLSFYGYLEKFWAKPAVGVAIAGIEGMEGYTRLMVESFIKLTLADLRGATTVYGALPGEIFLEGEGREAAAALARALTEGREESGPSCPSCPLCGGETFRFLPGGKVRCMLCSNAGDYAWQDGRLQLRIVPGSHSLFLSREDAQAHAEWLRGMKEKFLARRKELKAITTQYLGEGSWVRPEKAGGE